MPADWWDDATAQDWAILAEHNEDRRRMREPMMTMPELYAERERVLSALEAELGIGA